ncbi:hypothetical protein TI04_09465 [Achromatium sp. WMS2]|nr:hypothetical protein TI04_09465 [Achromatium sp. WMS2]
MTVFCYGGFIMSKLDEDIQHGHYLIHPDGTVTDTRTGLMWKRCAEGQTWNGNTCVGEAIAVLWNEVMPNGQQKSWPAFAGYDDWRMPTIDELRTLAYCSSGKPRTWNDTKEEYFRCEGNYQRPTIDQVAFPNTDPEGVWSSSPVASVSSISWALSFDSGYAHWYVIFYSRKVRLVRAGRVQ